MSRRQIAFLTTMVLVLCAGVVVGRLTNQVAPAAAPEHGPAPSWIAQQLDLSSEQRQQMDGIWAETRQKMEQSFEKRHELDKQRDAQVQALLSADQRAAFEKIVNSYHTQRSDLDKQREGLIHDAETRSRALLDDTQQKRWDELAKEMHPRHGMYRSGGSPQTQPATSPG